MKTPVRIFAVAFVMASGAAAGDRADSARPAIPMIPVDIQLLSFPVPQKPRKPCVNPIDARITAELARAMNNPEKILHSGIFHVVLPKNRSQYERMNKIAIAGVTVYSRRKEDLPADSFYFAWGWNSLDREIVRKFDPKKGKSPEVFLLPRIFLHAPVTELAEGSKEAARFGRYRQDTYIFIPIRILLERGEFGVRFAGGRNSLQLGMFPLKIKEKFIVSDKTPAANPQEAPEPELTGYLVRENFCW
ncbi:MAG: hypothetical protein A2583_09610 [Bdellovibrionales bacterium RIFOXYD1_FULL_53_11]|nr:MAG: hypothetical protein A2583_09610 [Bdellovibrionales bacterium RIFOXYD1_FULL_53_11]